MEIYKVYVERLKLVPRVYKMDNEDSKVKEFVENYSLLGKLLDITLGNGIDGRVVIFVKKYNDNEMTIFSTSKV